MSREDWDIRPFINLMHSPFIGKQTVESIRKCMVDYTNPNAHLFDEFILQLKADNLLLDPFNIAQFLLSVEFLLNDDYHGRYKNYKRYSSLKPYLAELIAIISPTIIDHLFSHIHIVIKDLEDLSDKV